MVREGDMAAAGPPFGRWREPDLRATCPGVRRGHDGREFRAASGSTHVAACQPDHRPPTFLAPALVIGALAAIRPARRAARLHMLRSIRSS